MSRVGRSTSGRRASKLALEDTWRYTCPECGTHLESGVRRRTGTMRSSKHGPMEDPTAPFHCDGCSTALCELYDKKEDETVHLERRNLEKHG